MGLIAFLIIGVFHPSPTFGNFQKSTLYRNEKKLLSFGNFKRDHNRQLSANTISSYFVDDKFDCTSKCVGEPSCYSFNMAAYPDSKGLYLCELLPIDKYRATANDLQENASFHHFSPWVSWRTFIDIINIFASFFTFLAIIPILEPSNFLYGT